MRTLKLLAIAVVLTLAGAVYAVRATQDAAPKTQDAAKSAKSCCLKHDAAKAGTHEAAKHEGESCCAAKHDGKGCCSGAGGCCGDSCSKEHQQKAVAQKTAAGAGKAGCCSGGDSCCGGACAKGHAGAKTQAAAHTGESCCKEGAACCKEGAKCCEAHKAGGGQVAARKTDAKPDAAGCCGGSCACCAGKADHKAHAGGR